jgi:hypothetical protein
MKISCADRERVFLEGTPEEWAALELHARACSDCAGEVQAWKALTTAAEQLRDYRDDPLLWSRIEVSLQRPDPRRRTRQGFAGKLRSWSAVSPGWQAALASAAVLLLALSGVYLLTHRKAPVEAQNRLLKNSALVEVERAERDYTNAIDKLALEAKPQLETPASALMASYREKLVVLDSAIDELREQAGRNPSNAHLRYQLLAMYQEKQQTLEEVLEIKP